MDWELELIKIQLSKEANEIIREMNEMVKRYLGKFKCTDCPADGCLQLNDSWYCESCYREHTSQVEE